MSFDKIIVPEGGKKITATNGVLNVPDNPILMFIEGDGIGYDIMTASKRIWDAAIEKAYGGNRKVAWMEIYSGEKPLRCMMATTCRKKHSMRCANF